MGTSGSAPDVSREDARDVFSQFDDAHTPLTTSEVADRLDCAEPSARDALRALADSGELQTRELDDARQVWWRANGDGDLPGPNREEFGAFVSAVKDYAIFVLDPDGVVASWNEGAERIKGYAADEIVGQHFSTFYTEDDRAEGVPERNLERAAEAGRTEDEGWRVRADGTRFWAKVTITAVRGDDGELKGFTKVTRDMTERREYEQELRRERDVTEQILETVPVGIALVDRDGTLVRANERTLNRFGLVSSSLDDADLDDWDYYDPDGESIPPAERPWARVAETDVPVHGFECQVDLPETGRRWLSINAAPVEDDHRDREQIVLSIDDVTEQKERERQLEREYDQTEKLLRTAPIAIEVQNADRETVMANRRAQEAFGLSEQEFKENPVDEGEWEIYRPDGEDIPADETPSGRALATGEPVFNEQIVIEPPDGEPMHFRINAAPLYGPDGEIERVVTAGEEITELKRRERQLEQRKTELETELSEILGRISDAFYALDEEWRFTHLNDRAAEIVGRSADELLGRSIWEEFPEAADGELGERLRAAMRTQEPDSFETDEGDGDAWLEFNVYPSETGLSVYFRDVTERKRRERELEESERRYRTLAEHFPNGAVALVDEDLRYQTVGGEPRRTANEPAERIEGRHVDEAVPPALADELVPRYEAALEGESSAFEMELDGGYYQFQTVPVRDEDGDVFAALGMSQDVSERREYERKLEESNERLEQFAYAASHDLQEPLRMVSSYLQLIERRYDDELDAEGREFIDYAVDGADRMREMIEGLLEYSRVETRGDPFEPVDLDDVLADVRTDLDVKIAETDAEITADPLPTIEGDAGQLRQVFQNLLDNAIEYSGDEPPRVHVGAERDGDWWTISVSDEGIGIDPADADRVFEVFQSLHAHDEHGGTGIGLALCERIVERHGGDIWVDAERGDGSTFSFTLPATDS